MTDEKKLFKCWLKDNHHVLMVPKLRGMGTRAVIRTVSVCRAT